MSRRHVGGLSRCRPPQVRTSYDLRHANLALRHIFSRFSCTLVRSDSLSIVVGGQCKQATSTSALSHNTNSIMYNVCLILPKQIQKFIHSFNCIMTIDNSASEDPISENVKADIVRGIWHKNLTVACSSDLKCWDTTLSVYTAECKKAISYSRGECTTVRTHRDVITIAEMMEKGCNKEEIARTLLALDTQRRTEEAKLLMVEGSLRLVGRLVSMVDVGSLPESVQGWAPVMWSEHDSSLQIVLKDYFLESTAVVTGIKFSEGFTARNLQKFAGIRIQWTNNLANHLRLMDNDTTLCVFHHVCFLKHQSRFATTSKIKGCTWLTRNSTSILPPGLAEETLRTIALLFPCNDRSTRHWLQDEYASPKTSVNIDRGILNCGRLRGEQRHAESFKFWREELITLKELFDQPRPTSLAQFWYDRRNKVQWYTFWIAVFILCLTIFFGLVQSIEGALQVYKAYHPT